MHRDHRQARKVPSTSTPEETLIRMAFLQDNPLHIALFPPHDENQNAHLEFSFLLNASLDIFEARTRDRTHVNQDLGMLQAIDESLSIWGWQTGTGTRFAIITDVRGKSGARGGLSDSEVRVSKGVTDADVRVVSGFYDLLGIKGAM